MTRRRFWRAYAGQVLDALSPHRRRLVLGVIALAVAVVLTIVIIVVVRTVDRPSAAPQDQLGPVLLVPGYGGDGASLQSLAADLRNSGRDVTVVAPVGDGTGDLAAQADHLGEVATQVITDHQAPSVDVIGYSAGGVVARLWARDDGGASVARRIVTLGSPHHGTSVAALGAQLGGGCPTACEQLVPDSDLLRRLNAGDETPAGPAWVTVRSIADQVVTPVDSAALEGALNIVVQDLCPGSTASHPELPDDPAVRATVTAGLGRAAPTMPTDVSC